jgi:hypothetical protein
MYVLNLYHGSNVVVQEPKIIVPTRALDFGAGFYTTSSYAQACRWAELQAKRRNCGIPVVSVYEYDESQVLLELAIKRFAAADIHWLSYVAQNRTSNYTGKQYDIVIGPVANDNTMAVISDYIAKTINMDTALLLLKPQKLNDQYAFCTHKGLSMLRFSGKESL